MKHTSLINFFCVNFGKNIVQVIDSQSNNSSGGGRGCSGEFEGEGARGGVGVEVDFC